MITDFKVETNALQLKQFLNSIVREQLPFATSKTLNGLAFDAKDKEQSRLDQYFDLRTGWLKKRGAMPVVKSHKSQFPKLPAAMPNPTKYGCNISAASHGKPITSLAKQSFSTTRSPPKVLVALPKQSPNPVPANLKVSVADETCSSPLYWQ